MKANLSARFLAAWGDPTTGEDALADLERRYATGHRAYHDLRHVDECLQWTDAYLAAHSLQAEGGHIEQTDVTLALFFHDAVLEPGRDDNERLSSELFRFWAHAARFPEARVQRVSELILATALLAPLTSVYAQLVRDVDFAILGAAPQRYREYAASVRREFATLPTPVYRLGRAQFLQNLLLRPALYHLPFFRERLEGQARLNLEQELAGLEAGVGGA